MAHVCKVLIVENDDHVRDLLGTVFDDEGYLFCLVKSGAEMREKLDEDDFDIAVVDVTQPGHEDGFVLAQIARERGCGPILGHRRSPPFGAAAGRRRALSPEAVSHPATDRDY